MWKNRVTLRVTSVIAVSWIAAAACGAASQEAPTLADNLRPMAFFQGVWSCQGEFPRTGTHIASHERFAPDLVGDWLVMRHVDLPPFGFHALEMWGYEASQKQFVNYIFDNAPEARRYVSHGWVASRLTWTSSMQAAKADRFVFERRGESEYQVDYARTTDGRTWQLVDTLDCRRQKA